MDTKLGQENRRSTRVRRVLPMGFKRAGHLATAAACKTVSANISRGGMLLVTREDEFPATGIWVDLMPMIPEKALGSGASFSGRIVYKRFSPKAELSFAGLEFAEALSPEAARAVRLDSEEDDVIDALKKLQELEDRKGSDAFMMTDLEVIPIAVEDGDDLSLEVSSEPTEENSELEVEAERLYLELESTCKRFMAETRLFMRSWAEQKLAETVAERHALSRAKGPEGLRALKTDLNTLLEDYPALLDAQLDRDEHWAHRDEVKGATGSSNYYDADNEMPAPWLVEELRRLMGFTGVLLVKHGFEELSNSSDWAPVSHGQALVAYRGRFAISDEMASSLKLAALQFDTMRAKAKELHEAREMRARDEIKKMWYDV